jgi:hypothetical protein
MGKITHVYLKNDAWARVALDKLQDRVGKVTPAEVCAEIRFATLDDDKPGKVLVLCPYSETSRLFEEMLQRGQYAPSRVEFIVKAPEEIEVYQPAGGLVKQTLERRLHLGTYCNMVEVKKLLVENNASMLIIPDPNTVEDDLRYLPELMKQLPHLDVVIFYSCHAQWGVVVEGGEVDKNDAWDTKSEVENENDLPWAIEQIAHVGESTWFGALPKVGKTWVLLCILLALLTGWSLFGDERFKVPHKAKRVIYLCPEAGRGSIKKRLKLLGLIDYLYDPITNPDGVLYLQTLSKPKIALNDPLLLELAKDADVFIDTAVRYLDGSENDVKDVKIVTENVLNLLTKGARSVWVAHHSAKGFENASSMTLGNMFRGSGEFGAAGTNFYGLCTEDEATTRIRFHCICGRDLDELIPDMILQGRPYLSTISNFGIIDNNAGEWEGNAKSGRKEDSQKKEKVAYARTIQGSLQAKADAVNEKFDSDHPKSTIGTWLKETA